MSKKWPRGLSAGLLLCLALSLAACSSSLESAGSGSNAVLGSEDFSKEAADMITLKVGFARDPSFKYEGSETLENNAWNELYAENGIKLEVMYNVEISQGDEKLAQMIMSGDYPDIMTIKAKNYLDWAEQGVFADLTPHFDAYASELVKKYYSDTEWGPVIMKAATTTDGKLYGLPTPGAGNDAYNLLWIRKDWLDNLGLPNPRTVDELLLVAKAFTESDPDGNGRNDTYGIAFNGKDVFHDIGGFDGFFQMFGAVPGIPAGTIPFIDIDGRAAYGGSNAAAVKEALAALREMYENGYMAKDFVTAGSEQVKADLSAGKAGMMFGAMSQISTPWQNVLEIQPEAHFIALGLPGVTEDTWGQGFYTNSPPSFYCLSSKAADKEEYIQAFFTVMNLGTYYLNQPDVLTQEEYERYNGKAGTYTGWQLAIGACASPNNNFIALPRHQEALKTGDTSAMNAMNIRDYNSMMGYVNNKDRRDELNEEELNDFNSGLLFYSVWGDPQCAYVALQSMIDNGNIIYSAYEAPQTNSMMQNASKLDTLAKETIVNIVMGNNNIDYYDEFLELWHSLGGEQATQDADEWYQASKTAKQ